MDNFDLFDLDFGNDKNIKVENNEPNEIIKDDEIKEKKSLNILVIFCVFLVGIILFFKIGNTFKKGKKRKEEKEEKKKEKKKKNFLIKVWRIPGYGRDVEKSDHYAMIQVSFQEKKKENTKSKNKKKEKIILKWIDITGYDQEKNLFGTDIDEIYLYSSKWLPLTSIQFKKEERVFTLVEEKVQVINKKTFESFGFVYEDKWNDWKDKFKYVLPIQKSIEIKVDPDLFYSQNLEITMFLVKHITKFLQKSGIIL